MGELGNGIFGSDPATSYMYQLNKPTLVLVNPLSTTFTDISAGYAFTCALASNGSAMCWCGALGGSYSGVRPAGAARLRTDGPPCLAAGDMERKASLVTTQTQQKPTPC